METKTEKDLLQDREIKSNAERITRNEQAIQRQAAAELGGEENERRQ